MNNGYPPYPPYPPRPYGPDWPGPNVHPDWPHYRYWHHWNDSEPAALVPWNTPCCPPSADECVCVTYQDIEMWNTISAVSAFAQFDIAGLSGLSALSGISEMLPAAWLVGEYSGTWMSAQYVPNIYDQLSAISAKVDQKEYISATSGLLDVVYADPYYFAGSGTKHCVLKPSLEAKTAFEKVLDVTYDEKTKSYPWTLVTNKECDQVFSALKDNFESIQKLFDDVKVLNINFKAFRDEANAKLRNLDERVTALENKIKNK